MFCSNSQYLRQRHDRGKAGDRVPEQVRQNASRQVYLSDPEVSKLRQQGSAMFGRNLQDQGTQLRYHQDVLQLADNKVDRLEAELAGVYSRYKQPVPPTAGYHL